jgi:hypothetical protein
MKQVVFLSTNGLFRKEKPLCFSAKVITRRFLKFLKGIISAQQPTPF